MARGRVRSLRRAVARAAPLALAGAIVLGTVALLVAGDGSRRAGGERRGDPGASAPPPPAPATPQPADIPAAPPTGGGTPHPRPAAVRGTGAPAPGAEEPPAAEGGDVTAPARIRALRDAVQRAPRDGEARRALAVELIDDGEVDEGARLLVEAARLLGREALQEHGVTMLRLLHANAREEEEAQVRERIEALGL